MMKNCIITGGSSGLGSSLISDLIRSNYRILSLQRNSPITNQNVDWIKADFTELTYPWKTELVDWLKKNKQVDLLINNAAQYLRGPFKDTQVTSMMAINLISPIVLTNVIKNFLVEDSLIMNINSVAGKYAMEFEPVYSASKHGLKGFSKSLRLQLAEKKINVCDVYPGGMNTELWSVSNPYPGINKDNIMEPEQISNFLMYIIKSPNRNTFKEITLHPIEEKFV